MTKSISMVKQIGRFVIVALLVFILGVSQMGVPWNPSPAYAAGPPALAGRVIDSQGEPVRGAEVGVREGTAAEFIAIAESQHDGTFVVDLPPRQFSPHLVVELDRTHFQFLEMELEEEDVMRLNAGESVRLPDIELSRRITPGFWVATLVFAGVLALIALEKLHNTMAALLGTAIVLGTSFVGGAINPNLFIFDFEQALELAGYDVRKLPIAQICRGQLLGWPTEAWKEIVPNA